MRLTLRTLLAYMDDILDPADHEELAQIEASPFATELIHRSRDAIRRLRLSAPEVLAGDEGDLHGGESNFDANTAAEYLDSLLSPEEIADFERSCLEAGPNADMLLAEAVSCHHILTLVLGEPAEVDADLRQRMYALADEPAPSAATLLRIEPGHTPPSSRDVEAALEPPHMPRRPQIEEAEAEVPDYMLEAARARRRKQRAILSVVGMAMIGGIATWAFWPQGEVKLPNEVAKGDVDVDSLADGGAKIGEGTSTSDGWEETSTADAAATDDEAPAATTADSEAPAFVATPPAEPATTEPVIGATSEAPPASSPASPVLEDPALGDVAVDPAAAATVEPASTTEPAATEISAVPPAPPTAEQVAAAGAPASSAPAVSTPDGAGPPPIPSPPADATANVTPPQLPPQTPPQTAPEASLAAPTATDSAPAAASGETTATSEVDKPAVVESPKTIGHYLGNSDLLLRYATGADGWIRLPPRSALAPGDRLLALPNFRTPVVLADANVYLGGGTEIDLAAPEVGGESPADINLAMPYGRLVINSGLNGNRVRLTVGDQTRTLVLGASSSLAVEVERTFVPGADPEREPAPVNVSWYLTSGTVTPADALEGSEIEAPASWTIVDGEDTPPQAIDELPEWIDREPVSDSQRRALEPVEAALAAGSPVSLRLAELSDPSNLGRRIEVRSLAAEAGAYVGQFDPLVKTLSDVNQKAAWKDRIEALREAIAREGAPAVAGIRESFAVQRGEDEADDLVAMLIGFSPEDVGTTRAAVKDGALVRLVRWLENDDLTHRVLALNNINSITGTSSLGGYRPEHTAEQRRREVQYYWTRLEKGELLPKE